MAYGSTHSMEAQPFRRFMIQSKTHKNCHNPMENPPKNPTA